MCLDDPLVAYLLDSAVVTFGRVIENHLEETVNRGSESHPKYEAKYKLTEILSKDFKFPVEKKRSSFGNKNQVASGVAMVLALAEQPKSGVKRWEYKPN